MPPSLSSKGLEQTMMLTVEVNDFSSGKKVKRGEIWTDGERIGMTTTDGSDPQKPVNQTDSMMLSNIVNGDIFVGVNGEKRLTKDNPAEFVRMLHEFCSGSMLVVTQAREQS
jgi:hypothetical protein